MLLVTFAKSFNEEKVFFTFIILFLKLYLVLLFTIDLIAPLLIASLIVILSNKKIYVLIDNLSKGGVKIKLNSLTPERDNCKVLGIGVSSDKKKLKKLLE